MKHSYSDVIEKVEEVFLSHPQVNSVDNGMDLEFDIKKRDLFPRVFIKTMSSDYQGRWEYVLEIVVMDYVNNDKVDRMDTMNRCYAICVDGVSKLNYMDMTDAKKVKLTPLYNYQDVQTAGWMIALKVFSELGLNCEIYGVV